MELTRAYKFRIYPDATRQWEIDERLVLAQQFYNKVLAQSIYNASWNRFINMLEQVHKHAFIQG
ncbi:MAG: helix-turn-helix domain-containing protein [Candidatus Marsarchaeota archaeon]|nr:helix-turn-helix domain-containing protein [Candidatus Marsarchaeota archaeon]